MTDIRRYHRDTMVAAFGDQWVDVTVLEMIRFHADTPTDQEILLHLLSIHTRYKQLEVLLPHFGTRQPIQCETLTITKLDEERNVQRGTLIARIMLTKTGPEWWRGDLTQDEGQLPISVINSLFGEPLSRLITHPYLPKDMIITKMERQYTGWKAEFHD